MKKSGASKSKNGEEESDLDLEEEERGDEQATADVNAAESAAHDVEAEDEPATLPANIEDKDDRRGKFAALAARSRGRKLGQV